jgi:hypothetical protein
MGMKRVWTTIAIVAFCLAPLGADVTVIQTMSMEGAMAAALGGQEPKIVMKIKGNKARSEADVMGNSMVSITDLDARQLIILNSADKTAQVISLNAPAAKPDPAATKTPDADINFKATGNKRTLDGVSCDDHSFSISMDMAQFSAGQQMPPEAAEMMKGVILNATGLTCIAKEGKGVADFSAFQKAAANSGVMTAALGGMPGGKPGAAGGGMEKLMAAVTSAPGLPYITEITITVDGTGPMVDMLKQMGAMKMIQKTTSVTTDALSDDLFKVPADYKVEKK